MSGEILTAAELNANVDVQCDVGIVGTGAGGAVLAAGLAEAGLNVVMLEAGPHLTQRDFTLHEAHSLPAMYQDSGSRSTTNNAFIILQGRSVGGSTTVNWTTCFRTPERILAHWRAHHGMGLTAEELRPHFEAVERRLSIQHWPHERANTNNQKLLDGCAKLGWKTGSMNRNIKGCVNSGYCGMGCPVGAKQSMINTYLPDAVGQGAMLFADTRVERMEVQGDRVVALHGRVKGGGPRVTVRPKVAVLAGGALNGPALLLRSGLDRGGLVGQRTFLHPVTAGIGHYPDAIDPWYGAPQSAHSHQFIDRGPDKMGYFFEALPLHPVLLGTSLRNFGPSHMKHMATMQHLCGLIALGADGMLPQDTGGTVTLTADGNPAINYPHTDWLIESVRSAMRHLCQVHFAAGADYVLFPYSEPRTVHKDDNLDVVDSWPISPREPALGSAHQMGGCTMGSDADKTVVDLEHRFRGVPNLFVVDGSVLPTSLGVNPSVTIYAMARRAREFVGNAV